MPSEPDMVLRPQRTRSAPELAEALRHARKVRGLTQTALAKVAGIRAHHISRIESGAVKPNIDTLFVLLSALGLDLTLSARDSGPGDPDKGIEDIF
ncbi:helix-turn-helix domain-containing protein [Qingshengfaniella alkalisoli]|uniref:Helix-turn-helix transcriptional regulator n=1 Tax=Qingshengfaniella alkalisoli TaxID=2599296 RepID=A0A5B8IAV1_9RHOB|nr:helix-turn-helix transcriptional regulator [Qingshengfaniella alkalisoli]QDY70456.1 helix-turn-helix transcriptional regulator [Qingshengfaniella alkalisoli]